MNIEKILQQSYTPYYHVDIRHFVNFSRIKLMASCENVCLFLGFELWFVKLGSNE